MQVKRRGNWNGNMTRFFALTALLVASAAGCDDTIPVETCSIHPGDPGYEEIELTCDGLDNDCDGLTDVLLPIASNACTTAAKGTCGSGFAGCQGLVKQCLTPPVMPESKNGLDDDCDGMVDNLTDVTATTAKLRVVMPQQVWSDVPTDSKDLNREPMRSAIDGLMQAGLAFDAPDAEALNAQFDWNKLFANDLSPYTIILIPGYVDESFFAQGAAGTPDAATDELALLRKWVTAGGTLVWNKPVMPWTENGAAPVAGSHGAAFLDLAGVVTVTQALDVDQIDVVPNAPATYYLDSPTERQISVIPRFENPPPAEVLTYVPDEKAGTQAFGVAKHQGQSRGATWLRRPLGKGAVYTIGWDPLQDAVSTCDLNCFSPGRDIGVGILRAIAQEAAHGHAVWKHTVPGVESTVLISTHDIDAPDSHNANPKWGDAGALQSAQIEKNLGILGSYFVTTDYYVGYFNPGIVDGLCALGSCPEAAHSVLHRDMQSMPAGTCSETKASYDPTSPTVCGEIRVSKEILESLLPKDQPIRAWRTPYLQTPETLYKDLESLGIVYDSSFSMGDVLGTLPVYVPRNSGLREAGGVGDVFSFPIVQEDGLGDTLDDGTFTRWELQSANASIFMGRWTWALLENMRNNGWSTYLLHPSYGVGTNANNLAVKLDTMQRFLTRALTFDLRVERMTAAGDFWRGREGTTINAHYVPGKGYQGTIHVGKRDAPRFSLEFGDRLASFDCPDGGKAQVKGRRIVFEKPLTAGATLLFTATLE